MNKKTTNYLLITTLIASWKSRAKKAKVKLKDLAKDSDISAQHFTKILQGRIANPRLDTINNIEMNLRAAEEKAGV